MLNHLTTYLFQYRSVSIPHVGTIHLVQQPPQLNVVDKLLLPPSFSLEFKKGEEVSDHQLSYLNAVLQKGKDDVLTDLRFFGYRLQEKINGPGFNWEGLGTITRSTQTLPIAVSSLEAVPAHRVLRQDVRHKVLVGDQHMLSGQPTETETYAGEAGRKHSIFMIIGWIVLVLSIIAIAVLLYLGKFRVKATGSRLSPTSFQVQQQDKLFGWPKV
jgi:hypothetical protein